MNIRGHLLWPQIVGKISLPFLLIVKNNISLFKDEFGHWLRILLENDISSSNKMEN